MAVTTTVADRRVVGGVDTHKDTHVAAVLDDVGQLLATQSFQTTAEGYSKLLSWLGSFGEIDRVGVEGTASWGAGLSRYLSVNDVQVIEVSRQNRQRRRLKGKSDTVDAEMAARAAMNGDAIAVPKAGNGAVEAIRMFRIVTRSAIQSRSQTANQIHSLIDTAPDEIREQFRSMSMQKICNTASRLRPNDDVGNPITASKTVLRHLAKRWLVLSQEITEVKAQLRILIETSAPPELLGSFGVGVDTAGALMVSMGDNPERCQTEQAFAALCGVSPRDASSGRNQRHRLNRGGDRTANNALWRIAMVRLAWDPTTRAYMERRRAEGKTKREAIRCLKRYIARQVWRAMQVRQEPLSQLKSVA